MSKDSYLKTLCDRQKDEIQRWKNYCFKEEKLLAQICLAFDGVKVNVLQEELLKRANKFLNEEGI